MGKPGADDAEVEAAATAAGCDSFIRKLENGYDTVVGGGGAHLSGGERQRIAIARAMLKDAPIVILDEATAYIDPENEAVVQKAVAKLGKREDCDRHCPPPLYHHGRRPDLCRGRRTDLCIRNT